MVAVDDERKKSLVVSEDSSLDDDDKSAAGLVPAAMRAAAAGASTAVIICHELGALESTSTDSAACSACRRSLALTLLSVDVDEALVVLVAAVAATAVVVEGVVVLVVVDVVVDEVACFGDLTVCCCCCAAAEAAAVVSFELRWPKLAASLLLISDTAPRSADPLGERTVTNLTRVKFAAVGVDLITLLRILAPTCCSCCWQLNS